VACLCSRSDRPTQLPWKGNIRQGSSGRKKTREKRDKNKNNGKARSRVLKSERKKKEGMSCGCEKSAVMTPDTVSQNPYSAEKRNIT
jgi:hypothetical protein